MAITFWGEGSLVNTTTVNGQTAPAATALNALNDGGYVIAWVDDMGAAPSVVTKLALRHWCLLRMEKGIKSMCRFALFQTAHL
jgi:hypothetical protein